MEEKEIVRTCSDFFINPEWGITKDLIYIESSRVNISAKGLPENLKTRTRSLAP